MKPGPKRKPVKVRATRIAQALAGVSATELRRATKQLDLLPLPAVASPTPLDQAPDGPRQPGRPRGSRNKRTEETIAFILARYRNPLVVLAETYSRSTAELARLLSCKKREAFELQLEAAKQLAPYVASKMPQALEVDDRRAVALTLIVAPDMAPRGSPTIDQMPQSARVIESKEKQELSDKPKPRVGQKGVGQ
jgi:hypothetical protein